MDETISASNRHKGNAGEEIAVSYLVAAGYSIVARNVQSRQAEIDCIAQAPDGTLVFCEVKSCRSLRSGHPFSWITPLKQRKIVALARRYLAEHQFSSRRCRFDAIAVVNGKVEHLRNAFLS